MINVSKCQSTCMEVSAPVWMATSDPDRRQSTGSFRLILERRLMLTRWRQLHVRRHRTDSPAAVARSIWTQVDVLVSSGVCTGWRSYHAVRLCLSRTGLVRRVRVTTGLGVRARVVLRRVGIWLAEGHCRWLALIYVRLLVTGGMLLVDGRSRRLRLVDGPRAILYRTSWTMALRHQDQLNDKW